MTKRTPCRRCSTRRPEGWPLDVAVILALCAIYTDPGVDTHWRVEAARLCLEFFHGPPPEITEDPVQ